MNDQDNIHGQLKSMHFLDEIFYDIFYLKNDLQMAALTNLI